MLQIPKTKYRLINYPIIVINYYILGGKRVFRKEHDDITEERHRKGLMVTFEYDIKAERDEWYKWYLPPLYIKKDDLILDIGGRDGDSVLFYAEHGYTNIRVIEPDRKYNVTLEQNCNEIRRYFGTKIEIRHKPFDSVDLKGAKFAKFDCEGCENEIDISSLGIPVVAELHENIEKDRHGVYKSNSRWWGYVKHLRDNKMIRSTGFVRYNYGVEQNAEKIS